MNPKDFERVKLDTITLTKDNIHGRNLGNIKQLLEDFENIDSDIKEAVLRVIAESNTPMTSYQPEQKSDSQPPNTAP